MDFLDLWELLPLDYLVLQTLEDVAVAEQGHLIAVSEREEVEQTFPLLAYLKYGFDVSRSAIDFEPHSMVMQNLGRPVVLVGKDKWVRMKVQAVYGIRRHPRNEDQQGDKVDRKDGQHNSNHHLVMAHDDPLGIGADNRSQVHTE